MRLTPAVAIAAASLSLAAPAAAAAADGPPVVPVFHDELRRSLDELVEHMQGFGAQWRDHPAFAPFVGAADGGGEQPAISIALAHRAELGLSTKQVDALERLRADFQREAVRRDADLRVAEMDVAALRRAESVDLAQVEARVRDAERLRADLRVARIRAIEQGKAQLTAEQRDKLRALMAEPWPAVRPRAGGAPAAPPPPQRM